MKGKRNLLIGLLIGILISWISISFSSISKKNSFLFGFITCLGLVLLGLMLLLVWNNKAFVKELFRKETSLENGEKVNSAYVLIRLVILFFILFVGLVSSLLIFRQQELSKTQMELEYKNIKHQFELKESVRTGHLVHLMSNVFDKIDEELSANPKGKLSESTIGRVAALSYSFKPYWYLEGDSLSREQVSPERGYLLLNLCQMNIDSNSFNQIKKNISFANADLRKANLTGVDLSGVSLNGANLSGADLSHVNLSGANLKEVNLSGANLNQADLSGANLYRSNLAWTELNGSDLRKAQMDGVDMTSAKLRKANLAEAKFEWANFNGSFLNEANLNKVKMSGSTFIRANLSESNLSEADLTLVDLSESNLAKANLTKANLKKTRFEIENWLEKLNEWQVIGAKAIQENYKVVVDQTGVANYRVVRIEK